MEVVHPTKSRITSCASVTRSDFTPQTRRTVCSVNTASGRPCATQLPFCRTIGTLNNAAFILAGFASVGKSTQLHNLLDCEVERNRGILGQHCSGSGQGPRQ